MAERIKSISNPLTIIAVFAALAEINATVSIGLVDKELQATFIWFVIGFPTLLVILFFITLNFNTKVIYAPSDYKDDDSFHKILIGSHEPDKEINSDKDIIKKTLDELGIKRVELKETHFNISDNVNYLFAVRYSIEKEVRRIASKFIDEMQRRPFIIILTRFVEQGLLTPTQHKVIRNLYLISSPAIHGDDSKVTLAEIEFVKQIAPGVIEELKKIK